MKKATAQRVAALPKHAQVQVAAIDDLVTTGLDAVDLYKSGVRAVLPSPHARKPSRPFTVYPRTPDPKEVELWVEEDQPRLHAPHGHHSGICAETEAPAGQSVKDHGPWCESDGRGLVDGWNDEGQRIQVSASIVDRYTRGVYVDYELRTGTSDRFIAIRIGDYPGEVVTYLPVGEALRLAAGINALAAAADRLDAPLSRARTV